ncbi:hypothetical protein BU17DRAFT_48617 [Hysterangium stoloniferum]|nr:hypothetical protein BU17DRAFT_48617 [Hysterangium stoloniferum]
MTISPVVAGKKALRATLGATLDRLSYTEIAFQSGLVSAHITSHPRFKAARAISCYLSMPSGELDTNIIARTILNEGKILFIPRIDKARGKIDMLRIYDEQDLDNLVSGKWGIREPSLEINGKLMDPDCPTLDLILLPGVAFDLSLSRLGHGKGYYDRFLTSYQSTAAARSVPMPFLCGLSLTQQIMEGTAAIPMEDHDWRLNEVVFPRGLISKRRK